MVRHLRLDAAEDSRDALAKAVYAALFRHLSTLRTLTFVKT